MLLLHAFFALLYFYNVSSYSAIQPQVSNKLSGIDRLSEHVHQMGTKAPPGWKRVTLSSEELNVTAPRGWDAER